MTTRTAKNLPTNLYGYKMMLDAAPDAILILDRDGLIHYSNEGIQHILGFTAGDLRGTDIRGLLYEMNGSHRLSDGHGYGGNGIRETELHLKKANGQQVTVWAKVVDIPNGKKNGHAPLSLVYLRDITERKWQEHLKEEFIGIVTHELRSPLTVVIGALHTALAEQSRLSPDDMRQLLEDATVEAEALLHTLLNFLELFRGQEKRSFLYRESTDVAKVIWNTVDNVRRRCCSHKLVVDIPDDLPDILADEIRLERILFNLLDNAIKYSPNGGEIRVSARQETAHIVLSVSDQGIGVSSEDRANIFKPFYRSQDSMDRGLKGTGLGLLVCQRLVEAHGGRIWVESEPGIGTTFYLTL